MFDAPHLWLYGTDLTYYDVSVDSIKRLAGKCNDLFFQRNIFLFVYCILLLY